MNKIPLLLFVLLVGFLLIPLLKGKDPTIIDSAMIGKPAPGLQFPESRVIVNFFASWCVECRAEQAALQKVADAAHVPVYGIDYKDTPEKLKAWLKTYGNPYKKIIPDADGHTAIDWGVYGVPETFIVENGIVRRKYVGAVTDDMLKDLPQ